jgi:hypothetical protein
MSPPAGGPSSHIICSRRAHNYVMFYLCKLRYLTPLFFLASSRIYNNFLLANLSSLFTSLSTSSNTIPQIHSFAEPHLLSCFHFVAHITSADPSFLLIPHSISSNTILHIHSFRALRGVPPHYYGFMPSHL